MAMQTPQQWTPGTYQMALAAALRTTDFGKGSDPKSAFRGQPSYDQRAAAFKLVRPLVGTEPLVFSHRGETPPIDLPKPAMCQTKLCWYRLGEVMSAIAAHGYPEETPAPIEDVGCGGCDNGECCGACECCQPAEQPEPKPEPKPVVSDLEARLERYWREAERLREFVAARGNFDPFQSMRIDQDGARAIIQGCPVDAVLYSLTLTWQADSRQQAGISDFDFASWRDRPSDFHHAVSEYVLALVRANVPVWLGGGAGTGKSTAAKHAADQLGLTYYEVNLAGAMRSAVTGRDRLKEFIESDFMRAYRDGGVCCIEEIDMAHPTVIGAINNAIAGDAFANDATGELIPRHPDFRLVATANTWGTGATKEFNGRNKLDGATLDRFRVGRVMVNRDSVLARNIFDSIVASAIA